MVLTKKNHFNPCFWTVYWNFDYIKSKRENKEFSITARDQKVFSLNLRSDKILNPKTEDIFFEKKAGLATITVDAALDFTLRNFPESYDEIKASSTGNLTIDFEDHFSKMEEAYRPALEKLILSDIDIDIEEKVHIAHFMIYQILRNPTTFNAMEMFFKNQRMEKFEMLYQLKHQLSNANYMKQLIVPLVAPNWTIYRLKKNVFPLSDCPLLSKKFSLMFVIAPDIMIEIDMKKQPTEILLCNIKKRISYFKYLDFLRRTINGSSREIIFGDKKLLEKIKRKRSYKIRINQLSRQ